LARQYAAAAVLDGRYCTKGSTSSRLNSERYYGGREKRKSISNL